VWFQTRGAGWHSRHHGQGEAGVVRHPKRPNRKDRRRRRGGFRFTPGPAGAQKISEGDDEIGEAAE
jgi:hypothetical protein